MAAVALLRTLASTTDGTSATTAAFTPTAGSLMVAVVAARACVINPGVVSTSDGMTFTLARRVLWGTNTHIVSAYVADAASVAASQTLNFNSGADNYSNVCIAVHEIPGMEKFGLDAVVQSSAEFNGVGGSIPTVAFSAPANTNNPVIFGVGVAANPAGLTEPAGFTETVDIGADTPTSGLHVSHFDSGFTGDTVTAGSEALSVYGAVAIEFDAPVASVAMTPQQQRLRLGLGIGL